MSDEPQKRTGDGQRGPDGRFVPGNRANPGGRPKGLAARVRETFPESDLVDGMVRIAKGQKIAGLKPTVAEIMRAREWLGERGWGKAPAFALIEGENPLDLAPADRAIDEVADELAARRADQGTRADAAAEGEAPAAREASA